MPSVTNVLPFLILTLPTILLPASASTTTTFGPLPSTLIVTYPISPVRVNSSFFFQYQDPELAGPPSVTYRGVERRIDATLIYPNGTQLLVLNQTEPNVDPRTPIQGPLPPPTERQCWFDESALDQPAWTDGGEGEYILRWDIQYAISSDPSQSNDTFCGPGPYSTQTFALNATVTVVGQERFTSLTSTGSTSGTASAPAIHSLDAVTSSAAGTGAGASTPTGTTQIVAGVAYTTHTTTLSTQPTGQVPIVETSGASSLTSTLLFHR
ncbi:hypothetical protein K435DRAFT_778770 [Dendrothele bispora CBS 962.96]|uniref:Uncharacterized protein n=1 Tax=Dendrothele bispora (strain CBS 962.96) TaxID=1314807 RepID=A0A4V4HFR6_DENBC|nr:hypothetical protein K435DRAFT_778770 [Dendrothele bispora CBS 962.96]